MKLFFVIAFFAAAFACSKKAPYPTTNTPLKPSKIKVAGYLPDYGINKFDPAGFALLDRVYYFSIFPDSTNGTFKTTGADTTNINFIKSKLSANQELFITVGGWVKSKGMPIMAADSVNKRLPYISTLISLCKYFGATGVDIDWEDYPTAINKTLYVSFIKQLSDSLKTNKLKLSVALGDDQTKAGFGAEIKDAVDNINIMNYGALDGGGNHSTFSQMTTALGYFVNAGIDKAKLNVGVPFYGKRTGAGATPPLTYTYSFIYNNAVSKPAANENKSAVGSTVYNYNGLSLLLQKVDYLRYYSYGGIMAWEISQDTSVVSDKSLLRTIYEANPAVN